MLYYRAFVGIILNFKSLASRLVVCKAEIGVTLYVGVEFVILHSHRKPESKYSVVKMSFCIYQLFN